MEDSCCWFCWDLGMVVEGKGELVGCFEVKSGTTQFGNWKWTVYISYIELVVGHCLDVQGSLLNSYHATQNTNYIQSNAPK